MAIQDDKGKELTLAYDPGTGLLSSVTENLGRSLGFSCYGDGKLETVTDPAGRAETFHYTGEKFTRVDGAGGAVPGETRGQHKGFSHSHPYGMRGLPSLSLRLERYRGRW